MSEVGFLAAVVLVSSCVRERDATPVDAGSDADSDSDSDGDSDAAPIEDDGHLCAVGTIPRFDAEAEIIDEEGGSVLSLTVDGRGNAHVLYGDMDGTVRYASNVAGSWRSQPVLEGLFWGLASSLELDADGGAHFLTSRVSDGEAIHAWRDGGGEWTLESIHVVPTNGWMLMGLALAPDGSVHALVPTATGLVHATNAGGAWTDDLLPGTDGESQGQLHVESDGVVHAAYVDARDELMYATGEDGAWSTTLVDRWLQATILGVHRDASGAILVGYDVWSPRDLRFAREEDDGTFSVTSRPLPFGVSTSGVGFDPSPRLHTVALRDDFIVYAASASDGWTTTNLLPIEGTFFDWILIQPETPDTVHLAFNESDDSEYGEVSVPRHAVLHVRCEAT